MTTRREDNAAAPDLGWLRDRRIAIRSTEDLEVFAEELGGIVNELYTAGEGGLLLAPLHTIAGDARRDLIELELDAQFLAQARVSSAGASDEEAGELTQLQRDAGAAKLALDNSADVLSLQRALVGAEEVRLRGRRLLPDTGSWDM